MVYAAQKNLSTKKLNRYLSCQKWFTKLSKISHRTLHSKYVYGDNFTAKRF